MSYSSRSAYVVLGIPAPAGAQILQGQSSEPDPALQPGGKHPYKCSGLPQTHCLLSHCRAICSPRSIRQHQGAKAGFGLAGTPVGARGQTVQCHPVLLARAWSVPLHRTAPGVTPQLGHLFFLTAALGSVQLWFGWAPFAAAQSSSLSPFSSCGCLGEQGAAKPSEKGHMSPCGGCPSCRPFCT